jgi:hypothetical protein
MVSEQTQDFIVYVGVILVALWIVLGLLGKLGFSDLLVGLRGTRRIKVDQEPRDQAERWLNNHRKSSAGQVPRGMKWVAYTGDKDVPPRRIGRLKGLEPHQEGYLVYVKTSRLGWSKPYIVPREMCSDLNRTTLLLRGRGYSTNGLYRRLIPLGDDPLDPDMVVRRTRRLFQTMFGEQVEVDAEEDAAWAQATALMPPTDERVQMAEVEVPHVVEKPYIREDQVVGR